MPAPRFEEKVERRPSLLAVCGFRFGTLNCRGPAEQTAPCCKVFSRASSKETCGQAKSKVNVAPVCWSDGSRFTPVVNSRAQEKRAEPDRKLRVVAVGGHSDDPQTCAGGTLTLFADQGHDVVALTLAGGPPPGPDADREKRSVRSRLDSMKMAEILKIRLDCLNYTGSNSGQFSVPIVYGTASEINGQRYKEFTEILLDKYKPDIVFTHWPIDYHMDHRAASLLTYSAWLASGRRFPLYYMEAETGAQTQIFFPLITSTSLLSGSERTKAGRP